MTLQQLEYIIAVDRFRHFGIAADYCIVTHPTLSAMIQKPRGIAQDLIRDGSVKVNHEILEDSSKLCNNEDTISIRGFGKYIYRGVIKTTKKDRYLIEFENPLKY